MKDFGINVRAAVVGIGGAGCNVVSQFYYGLPEVDAIAVDSDAATLEKTLADKKLSLRSITAGSKNRENDMRCEITEVLKGYDIVYVISGLGGKTGTVISPVVADVACGLGCMTACMVINPSAKGASTKGCVEKIRSVCEMTVVIENSFVPKSVPKEKVFSVVNASIVDYVRRHMEKLVSVFVADLSKNVKEAIKERKSTKVRLFAGAVPSA